MDHIAAKPPKLDEVKRAPVIDSWLVDFANWLYDEVEKKLPSRQPKRPAGGSDNKPAPDTKPSKSDSHSDSQGSESQQRYPTAPEKQPSSPQKDSAGKKASQTIIKMGETCPRPNLNLEIPNLFPER